jgi:hypothetical protein
MLVRKSSIELIARWPNDEVRARQDSEELIRVTAAGSLKLIECSVKGRRYVCPRSDS